MSIREWILLTSATGHFSLSLVAWLGSSRTPFSKNIALLCLGMFGWTLATFGGLRFGGASWDVLDALCTALTPPMVLLVIVSFVGQSRAQRNRLASAFFLFGTVSLLNIAGIFQSRDTRVSLLAVASLAFLLLWLPTLAYGVSLLVRHLHSTPSSLEQQRTRTLLAALAIGGVFGCTDWVNDFDVPVPSLAALGSLVATAMLTTLAARSQLLGNKSPSRTILYFLPMGVAAIMGATVVYQVLGARFAALAVALLMTALIAGALVEEFVRNSMILTARSEKLLALGRVSAQLSHDLKNPLAAMLGAVQILEAMDPDDRVQQREFLALLTDQARRLREIIDKYNRLGAINPLCTLVNLNEVVKRVAGLQAFAMQERISIELKLSPGVPAIDLDADLIATAIENLVRNALEAIEGRGTVHISTNVDDSRRFVWVEISDSGPGVPAREAEYIFDDFYTTKATGSGLGLAFVRRIMDAHGGRIRLAPRSEHGASFQLEFPVA